MSDWYSGSANQGEAIYGLDRIKRGSGSGYSADAFDGRANFRIFEYTLTTDKSKKASGITFTSTASGKIPTILGIAKKGYKLDPDGIDEMVNDKSLDGRYYNLAGQRVSKPVKGIYIINGKKVLVK